MGELSQEGDIYATCNYLVYPTSDTESCEVVTYNLGLCKDPPQDRCTNPTSYKDEPSCLAAKCKWEMGPTGGYQCVFPQ